MHTMFVSSLMFIALSAQFLMQSFSVHEVYAKEPSIAPPAELDPQRALDLNRKRGVSILSLSQGSSGLGLNFGFNSNSFGELILGGDWRQPTSRAAELQMRLSLGAHLQLIQARDDAMLTLGARFRVIYSEICEVEASLCADRSAISPLIPNSLCIER